MTTNRYWRLDSHPKGDDFAAALSLQHEELTPIEDGQIRIKADYLSMDAGTRMWMGGREDGYQPPLPLGTTMVGLALGRVTESRDGRFPVGSLARAFGQWADYSTIRPDEGWAVPLDDDIDDIRQHFGVLGLNGWTALYGVQDILRIKEGETLVVSAAAGATGSLAVQVGRILGAKVVGIAGGPDKCRYVVETLGADRCIDYKNEDVAAALGEIEGGIDAYFENVGGPILDAVLQNMALYGRIAVCGMIANYDAAEGAPGPRHYDQVLMRRLRIEGFFLPDVPERGPYFYDTLKRWYQEGKINVPFDVTVGLENTLVAYARMLTGKNTGKAIVDVRS
ncbi:NADP-dependent oxidoreductase [Croceicoccus ponticola]|uniref:NADP-dependent oxidoreductase n=1 Tax=Croceicoccus ponticola TaxID=2217664 RepID=A0A437GWU9_9SPHN|nr:NADP-dependent oxidoreductase [Croceicoccus ponticola]RVQ66564.1 NADP-dependent oxidoreductase [Croceicoccus ponticola]